MRRLYTMPVLLACVLTFVGLTAAAQDVLYICGVFEGVPGFTGDNWGKNAEMVSTDGGNTYAFEFTQGFPAVEFKITKGDEWWTTGNKTMAPGVSYAATSEQKEDDNMKLAAPINGVGKLIFDTQGKTVRFEVPFMETVYFTGVPATEWNAVAAYVWDGTGNGSHNAVWPGVQIDKTDKYYGGKPVYRYDFKDGWEPKMIIFNNNNNKKQTVDLDFTNNALYVLGGENSTVDGTVKFNAKVLSEYAFDTEAPKTYRTLYMDFGADRQTKGVGNDANKPKLILLGEVHPGHIDGTTDITKANQDNVREMTKVSIKKDGEECLRADRDLWSYTLTDQELEWVKDAIFYFPANGYNQAYCCGMDVKDNGNHAWDRANWLKYMYFADNVTSADGIANQGKATQSYITFDQYEVMKVADKRHIYFIGQGLQGFNEWKGLTSETIKTAEAEMNVVYLNVVRNDNPASSTDAGGNDVSGIKFKMSWLKPFDWWKESGESGGAINEQRSWATFNYGIIGFNTAHPARVDRKLNLYIAEGGAGGNSAVHVNRDKSYPINNSNQYDWFIPASDNTDEAYLIVDLNPECLSATMLAFSPNPQVKSASRTVSQVTLTQEQIDRLHSVEPAKAAEANGYIAYTAANLVDTRLTVQAAHHNDIKQLGDADHNYLIEYQFFKGGEQMGGSCTVDGLIDDTDKSFVIDVTGFDIFSDTNVGVRALYTYNHGTADEEQYKIKFHSKFIATTPAGTAVLPVPAVGEITDARFVLGTADDKNSLGIYASLPVSVDESTRAADFARYVDFELASDKASRPADARAEILYKDHAVVKSHPELAPCAIESLDSWASELSPSGDQVKSLPLVLTHAYRLDQWVDEPVSVTGKVYFIFPVLYNPAAAPEVASSSRAPRRRASAADYEGYEIKLRRTEAPVSYAVNTGTLTGIDDEAVASGADSAEPEYYDLRGVRMRGSLAPGLYLRRTGTRVEKVVVR